MFCKPNTICKKGWKVHSFIEIQIVIEIGIDLDFDDDRDFDSIFANFSRIGITLADEWFIGLDTIYRMNGMFIL